MFLFELRDFVGLKTQRLKLAYLVAQQFQARSRSALWRLSVQAFGQGSQRAVLFRHLIVVARSRVGIECVALGVALE